MTNYFLSVIDCIHYVAMIVTVITMMLSIVMIMTNDELPKTVTLKQMVITCLISGGLMILFPGNQVNLSRDTYRDKAHQCELKKIELEGNLTRCRMDLN